MACIRLGDQEPAGFVKFRLHAVSRFQAILCDVRPDFEQIRFGFRRETNPLIP